MSTALLVGLGGFVGSAFRYLTARWVSGLFGEHWFPFGTLAVNVVGCLLIGGLAGLSDARGVLGGNSRIFLFAGVLGGFTTFSAFGYETLTLLRNGYVAGAIGNVALQVALGLAAVWGAYAAARAMG